MAAKLTDQATRDVSAAFRRIGADRSGAALEHVIAAASPAALPHDEDQLEALSDELRIAMSDDRWGDLLGAFLTRNATEVTEWAMGD